MIAGSVTVAVGAAAATSRDAQAAASSSGSKTVAAATVAKTSTDFTKLALVCLFTALTAVSFGCYGPTLHKGQVAMAGSRLRPFLCVGVAYFLVAVVVPGIS